MRDFFYILINFCGAIFYLIFYFLIFFGIVYNLICGIMERDVYNIAIVIFLLVLFDIHFKISIGENKDESTNI